MGNADSIPIVSQVKSLVQAISGDNKGALQTQEQFIRTGVIASQINSAIAAIHGDPEEAKRIQEEFGQESLTIMEGLPLVGHAMSAGYAVAGDLTKAEQVALTATKSTVVAGSTLVALTCGPGAPVCAAALGSAAVVGTNVAWDGVESLVRNEMVGVIDTIGTVKSMVESNQTVDAGEVFDIAFEQTALAAGGAFGGFKLGKAGGAAKLAKKTAAVSDTNMRATVLAPLRCLCKREVRQEPSAAPLLTAPRSLRDIDLHTQSVDSMVQGILSVFLILKLVFSKSPLAKPYLGELCTAVDQAEDLEECHHWLIASLQKYDKLNSEDSPGPLISSLSTLTFYYDNMVAENLVGSGLELWLCSSLPETVSSPVLQQSCILRLKQGLRDLQGLEVDGEEGGRVRTKRRAMCCASNNFRRNHFVTETGDNLVIRKGVGRNTRILTERQEVYRKVAKKMEAGDFEMSLHRGEVQRVVRLEGLRLVEEVQGPASQVVKVAREGGVRVAVSQGGQLVHLMGE